MTNWKLCIKLIKVCLFLLFFRYNPFLDQGVSRYEFLFHMRRHKRAAFFKIFLPPLFIVLVVSIVKTLVKTSLGSCVCAIKSTGHNILKWRDSYSLSSRKILKSCGIKIPREFWGSVLTAQKISLPYQLEWSIKCLYHWCNKYHKSSRWQFSYENLRGFKAFRI